MSGAAAVAPPSQTQTLCTLALDKTAIRVFGSITQFLGKVGAYLFIEIVEHECTFRSLNDSSQSFASCKFDRAFFSRFVPPETTIRCKIPLKNFIAGFKNLRTVYSIELSFEQGAVESILVFKLLRDLGVVKK